MKIEDLYSLMDTLQNYYNSTGILNDFDDFHNILSRNITNLRQQPQPIDPILTILFSKLETFPIDDLSLQEKELSKKLEIYDYFGDNCKSLINNILRDQNFDPAGVVQKIETIKSKMNELKDKSVMIKNFLFPISVLKTAIEPGNCILQIHFLENTHIDNFVDFEKWVDIWYKILRNFAIAHGNKPEDMKVINVQKSSPLIIEVAAVIGVINMIGSASLLILKNIDKYLEIQRKRKEIAKMDYLQKQKEIISQLADEADKFKEISSKLIAKEIIKELKAAKIDGEVENGISLSIIDLYNFFDAGGKVETIPPKNIEDISDQKALKSLIEQFDQVRKLQINVQELKLIEFSEK